MVRPLPEQSLSLETSSCEPSGGLCDQGLRHSDGDDIQKRSYHPGRLPLKHRPGLISIFWPCCLAQVSFFAHNLGKLENKLGLWQRARSNKRSCRRWEYTMTLTGKVDNRTSSRHRRKEYAHDDVDSVQLCLEVS